MGMVRDSVRIGIDWMVEPPVIQFNDVFDVYIFGQVPNKRLYRTLQCLVLPNLWGKPYRQYDEDEDFG